MTPKQLKKIRLALNMGLGQLGKETNYSKGSIDAMERLGRTVPEDLVNKMKNILKKKLEELNKCVDVSFM